MTSSLVHDVLIIGAGPAGLAVAARLREQTPSAVFTDAEHSRYQWIKKHHRRTNILQTSIRHAAPTKTSSRQYDCRTSISQNQTSEITDLSIKVLDSSGPTWLHSWKSNFAALSIPHLRSPMFFHPCPRDRDGLLAYAHETNRASTCVEIGGCVGCSMSKHRRKKKAARGRCVGVDSAKAPLEIDERDRKDYYTPSTEVFEDYCDEIVKRYALGELVEAAQVASIEHDFFEDTGAPNSDSAKIFRINTSCSKIMFARTVVLAVGGGGKPMMPRMLSEVERNGACHSTQLPKQTFLPANLQRKIRARKPNAVLVVGGGLTSAQIVIKCIEQGVSRVVMVMRSQLKCVSAPPSNRSLLMRL